MGYRNLLAQMSEHHITSKDLAEILCRPETTVRRKLKCNGTKFLDIEKDRIHATFFPGTDEEWLFEEG